MDKTEVKQVEEMALTIHKIMPIGLELSVAVATDLYNADYRKQSEWISVEERLPERCGYYLGCTYKGGMLIAPFFPVFANDKPEFCYKIAYWMPLPEPPKKGGA